ncbi:MAG: helix-turn-helix domain-containing protein [Actinomycetota bacterium]|nr:helix-turn-helix domain-containing protein [Actinomycetota bacterium]
MRRESSGACTLLRMEDGSTQRRSDNGQIADNAAGGSGWTTTDVAAKALGVSPRSVRRFIDRGDLQGRKVKEGIVEAWEVSIDSLQALRDRRGPEGRGRRSVRRESDEGPSVSADMADLIRDLTTDLVRTSSEATELRVRLELTERAESTLREELERERDRREQAERRLADLELRLEVQQEMPQAPETPREDAGGVGDRTERAEAQADAEAYSKNVECPPEETARRPWWVRIFEG